MSYIKLKKQYKRNFLKTYSSVPVSELAKNMMSICESCRTSHQRWNVLMVSVNNKEHIVCTKCSENKGYKMSISKDAAIFHAASEAMRETIK